jgi:hypothetical protein
MTGCAFSQIPKEPLAGVRAQEAARGRLAGSEREHAHGGHHQRRWTNVPPGGRLSASGRS